MYFVRILTEFIILIVLWLIKRLDNLRRFNCNGWLIVSVLISYWVLMLHFSQVAIIYISDYLFPKLAWNLFLDQLIFIICLCLLFVLYIYWENSAPNLTTVTLICLHLYTYLFILHLHLHFRERERERDALIQYKELYELSLWTLFIFFFHLCSYQLIKLYFR